MFWQSRNDFNHYGQHPPPSLAVYGKCHRYYVFLGTHPLMYINTNERSWFEYHTHQKAFFNTFFQDHSLLLSMLAHDSGSTIDCRPLRPSWSQLTCSLALLMTLHAAILDYVSLPPKIVGASSVVFQNSKWVFPLFWHLCRSEIKDVDIFCTKIIRQQKVHIRCNGH